MAENEEMSHLDFTYASALLKNQRSVHCKIISDSMEPIIPTNAIVKVEPLIDAPKAFDILVFWQNEKLNCHVYIHNSTFNHNNERILIMKSYKYLSQDLPLIYSDVLGRVVSHRLSLFAKVRMIFRLFFSGR